MGRERGAVYGNMAWGIRWGLYFAAAFTLIALIFGVLRLFAGTGTVGERTVSLLATVAIYWVGGVVGGAIVGLLRGLLTGCFGAALVGILATVPASFALRIALYGLYDWTERQVITFLAFAFVWGGTMSLALWFTRDR
jgi:hypothetical protein